METTSIPSIPIVFFVISAPRCTCSSSFRAHPVRGRSGDHGRERGRCGHYAGVTLALAMIIGHAVEGDFEGWGISRARTWRRGCAGALSGPAASRTDVAARTAVRSARGALDRLVAQERNVGVSAVEAISYGRSRPARERRMTAAVAAAYAALPRTSGGDGPSDPWIEGATVPARTGGALGRRADLSGGRGDGGCVERYAFCQQDPTLVHVLVHRHAAGALVPRLSHWHGIARADVS
jgi:hypothetical protein